MAKLAGTSRTRLSAYEHGHTDPGLATLDRIAHGAGFEIAARPAGTGRVASQIGAIKAALLECDSSYALRLVAELLSWFRNDVIKISAIANDPGSTGDARWDALIGGVAEMIAHEQSHQVPAWASAPSRTLPTWWFVTALRSLRPSVFVETPPALASRGVLLSAASLSSV
jgi:transcriptional regulator with XRE-family HTH domain